MPRRQGCGRTAGLAPRERTLKMKRNPSTSQPGSLGLSITEPHASIFWDGLMSSSESQELCQHFHRCSLGSRSQVVIGRRGSLLLMLSQPD